jgi:predicted Zn-dependent protease
VKFDPRLPRDDVNVTARHPLKEAAVILAGVLIIVAVLLGFAVLVVDRLVFYLPPSWEASVFPEFDALQKVPTSKTEIVRKRNLEGLLERLLMHWPEHPEALRVGLLDSPQPNALAFPGGLILVSSGLLDLVESENELAFVLGHELGHYHGRDHIRSLGRGLALGLILTAIGQSGGAAELVALSGQLTSRSFSREQESSADAFGLALVATEFGHVAGATDFFEKLPAPDSLLERSLATYLATHPMSDDRVKEMEQLADDNGWSLDGDTTPVR